MRINDLEKKIENYGSILIGAALAIPAAGTYLDFHAGGNGTIGLTAGYALMGAFVANTMPILENYLTKTHYKTEKIAIKDRADYSLNLDEGEGPI